VHKKEDLVITSYRRSEVVNGAKPLELEAEGQAARFQDLSYLFGQEIFCFASL
jgi:hypothetical protein